MTDRHPKLTLSAEERELVRNSGWIHAKHRIIETVVRLFGAVHEKQRTITEFVRHEENNGYDPMAVPAKISRGERYLGLPYVVLDYPRCFGNPDIFAIRTIFWWGNFFSVQLLLQGTFRTKFDGKLGAAYEKLKAAGFSICVTDNPWQHHFERDNFLPIDELSSDAYRQMIRQKAFIKLGMRMELREWDEAEEKLTGGYALLMEILTNQAPNL